MQPTMIDMLIYMLVPVWNSTAHFRQNFSPEEKFSVQKVLSQTGAGWKQDPMWLGEVKQGSLVAVHSTVSYYKPRKEGSGESRVMSFNLLAIQILVMPK